MQDKWLYYFYNLDMLDLDPDMVNDILTSRLCLYNLGYIYDYNY